jgi:hypothetical protein
MKNLFVSTILMLVFAILAFGQSTSFSDANVEYTFDIPEATWKMTVKPTTASPNVEFVYGDRLDGQIEIRRVSIKADELVTDVILRETEQKLQFMQGFVAGKEETFAGNLKGKVFNFEFVKAGKNMSGRFYYLKANDATVYVLRFTGYRDKLRTIRNQTDQMARSFELKK